MKHIFVITAVAYGCVGISALLGQSEQAGLFGAILGVGFYCANISKEQK